MRKGISFLLVLALVFASFAAVFAADSQTPADVKDTEYEAAVTLSLIHIFLLTVSNVMISALNYQPSRLIHTQASTIDWAGLMEKTRQNSEELLEKAKESLGDLDVETILIEEPIGRVADNIVEIAKEKDVDLIVMGSNGIGSLGRRLYLGSVTNKVLHMTKKPVMVIQ